MSIDDHPLANQLPKATEGASIQPGPQGFRAFAAREDAPATFEDFIYRYPQSEKVPQAKENIKSLEGGVSKGSLEIAKFYDKTKQHKAAVIYYNDVIKQDPGSPDAVYAKNRIDALKGECASTLRMCAMPRARVDTKLLCARVLTTRTQAMTRSSKISVSHRRTIRRFPRLGRAACLEWQSPCAKSVNVIWSKNDKSR